MTKDLRYSCDLYIQAITKHKYTHTHTQIQLVSKQLLLMSLKILAYFMYTHDDGEAGCAYAHRIYTRSYAAAAHTTAT